MSYKSFGELDQSRLPDVVEGLEREDVVNEYEVIYALYVTKTYITYHAF